MVKNKNINSNNTKDPQYDKYYSNKVYKYANNKCPATNKQEVTSLKGSDNSKIRRDRSPKFCNQRDRSPHSPTSTPSHEIPPQKYVDHQRYWGINKIGQTKTVGTVYFGMVSGTAQFNL